MDFLSQTRDPLITALGSSACAIAQSPVSEADQQRHQINAGQMAQTTAVQDGARRTVARWLLVYIKTYPWQPRYRTYCPRPKQALVENAL